MSLPGLSKIENASWDYLTTAAENWNKLADKWEQTFTEVRTQSMHPGGTEWTGTGADAAQARTDGDMMRVRGPAEPLRDAAKIAIRGRDQQEAGRRTLVSTVEDVRNDGFNVADDYHVTPTTPDYSSSESLMAQMNTAQEHEDYIKSQVARLVDGENDLSRQLTTATQDLDSFAFPADVGEDGGAGAAGTPQHATLVDDVKRNPTIIGPATTPQLEQNQYDLQDQFQDGKGPTFGGDPRLVFPDGQAADVPRSSASELAQGPPGTRPLPTGTALGPDGHRYAFFSHPDGTEVPGVNQFATNGAVWDYTDPAHPVKVGDLPGIYQASGVYDPATKQMVIVGNTSNRTGDLTRGMWVSGQIDPAHPNDWISSLERVPGQVGLPGDRESQLVALQGGGYMLVGATNGGPISAITASTPQALIGAVPQPLIDPGQLPTVYGPTVTGTSIDPATGLETVQLRVSTWPVPDFYDPYTWTTTFGVQH